MPNPNLCPLKVADPKVYSLPGDRQEGRRIFSLLYFELILRETYVRIADTYAATTGSDGKDSLAL